MDKRRKLDKTLMSDEEYKILVTDLCSRLPHGVKVRVSGDWFYDELEQYDTELKIGKPSNLLDVFVNQRGNSRNLMITPYLRPMSSITVEEICKIEAIIGNGFKYKDSELMACSEDVIKLSFLKIHELMGFLYQRHFDYNGLIERGLALEAPEGMYKSRKL